MDFGFFRFFVNSLTVFQHRRVLVESNEAPSDVLTGSWRVAGEKLARLRSLCFTILFAVFVPQPLPPTRV